MSKKDKPLTVTFYIGGKQVDKLTDEQCDRLVERISEAASIYYTAHPEEFLRLKSKKEGN